MNPTPPYSIYIWVGLSLFTLEFGGQATYMETHPYRPIQGPEHGLDDTHRKVTQQASKGPIWSVNASNIMTLVNEFRISFHMLLAH